MFRIKNIAVFSILILLTLISNYLGHINAPFSISATPILIPVIASLLFFMTDLKIIPKFLCFIFSIILNDLLIKNFAGGIHDIEGQEWISSFLVIGLFLSSIPIALYFSMKERNKKKFILSAIISIVVIYCFMNFSSSFGRSWDIESTYSLQKSKSNGLYISNAVLSDSIIIYKSDTFKIDSAWIEYQLRSIHTGLFRKKVMNDNQNLILKLEGPFNKFQFENPITYKIDDPTIYGANYIDSLISIPLNNESLDLNFYHSNRQLIKTISIYRSN